MKSAPLFPDAAKSQFMTLTRQRYAGMAARMERKKLPPLPFTLADFRGHVRAASGGDGAFRCRYCGGWFTIAEVSADHAIPLSRGGWIGLDNIEYPCARCNSRKGSLTPDEFLALMEFLEKRIPMGRADVLERLEKAVQLMAGQRYNSGVIGELKRTGQWKAAQKARRERENA